MLLLPRQRILGVLALEHAGGVKLASVTCVTKAPGIHVDAFSPLEVMHVSTAASWTVTQP
jgi:hypothetical protein